MGELINPTHGQFAKQECQRHPVGLGFVERVGIRHGAVCVLGAADGVVLFDGEARAVALPLPSGVRGMHWDGEVGFAETASGLSPRDLDDFQPWLDAWTAAANPASPCVIAPLETLLRFTAAERTAIRAASAVSPELADWIDQARFPREIDLDAPTTAAGLDALVAAGLLTAGRRAAVLA
jgi:hypothetical protein